MEYKIKRGWFLLLIYLIDFYMGIIVGFYLIYYINKVINVILLINLKTIKFWCEEFSRIDFD